MNLNLWLIIIAASALTVAAVVNLVLLAHSRGAL